MSERKSIKPWLRNAPVLNSVLEGANSYGLGVSLVGTTVVSIVWSRMQRTQLDEKPDLQLAESRGSS